MSNASQESTNDTFYQLFDEADETFFLQFMATIVSEIKVERLELTKLKYSFLVMQSDKSAMDVEYICSEPKQEIGLNNLPKITGSIIFSSNAVKNGNKLEIHYDTDLVLLIMHPTMVQLRRFLKEI